MAQAVDCCGPFRVYTIVPFVRLFSFLLGSIHYVIRTTFETWPKINVFFSPSEAKSLLHILLQKSTHPIYLRVRVARAIEVPHPACKYEVRGKFISLISYEMSSFFLEFCFFLMLEPDLFLSFVAEQQQQQQQNRFYYGDETTTNHHPPSSNAHNFTTVTNILLREFPAAVYTSLKNCCTG